MEAEVVERERERKWWRGSRGRILKTLNFWL